MFHFVSAQEALTPEYEGQITTASAWVQLVHTGATKPVGTAGALVTESFTDLKKNTEENAKAIEAEASARKDAVRRLEESVRRLEESDLILANYVAEIQNLMREKDILTRDKNRIYQAQSIINDCQVCMDRPRTMRLAPCGHMATCRDCTERIMSQNGKCPLCRRPVIRFDETYLS